MIRLINCLRKRSELSDEEFRRYWMDGKFDELIHRVVQLTSVEQYGKNLTLRVDANDTFMRERGSGEPYDGILEYWWINAHELMEVYETPPARELMDEMLEYQRQFVDLSRSVIFFTECEMIGPML